MNLGDGLRAGYVLGQTAEEPGDSFGPSAWPVLCATVQGAAILAAWTQGRGMVVAWDGCCD